MSNKNVSMQRRQVLSHVKRYGKITQAQALRMYGIARLASVVHAIKRDTKITFVSSLQTVKNRYGRDCRVAVYSNFKNMNRH